ncbi:MAG: mannose-1-phosphate guanylyltransferase [Bacteroidota bacterium]
MQNNTYVAIMAGGIGSRFWPASRTARPKQFLDILGVGKSLIRLTFERFLKLCPAENIFIVTNEMYKDLVKEHLPELSDNQILCEPSRNNTAPCVAYTAFKLNQLNPNAAFVVAPSDHIILKEDVFIDGLQKAIVFAGEYETILTMGIQASRPDTGYGYIQYDTESGQGGIFKVQKFTEKPDVDRARRFLASGNYLWNAGIFMSTTQQMLRAFQRYAPAIYDILAAGLDQYNSPGEQAFINQHYPTTPSISIDYAIMEKADNIYTLPADIGWSDLGTWASLHAEQPKDELGNALNSKQVLLPDTSNCLIRIPADKLAIIKDLEDYIVVDEEDVLLIYPKSKEQEIKQLTQKIKATSGDTYL